MAQSTQAAPVTSTEHPVLSIERLSVTLPGGAAARPVLDHVSLTVHAGQTVGLVGESGSGKSVTCRAALGLFPARAHLDGSVRVAGRDVLTMTRGERRRMRARDAAMVFQDPRSSINPLRTVGDFLTEALRTHDRLTRGAATTAAAELLAAVGLRDPRTALRRYPHEFSGGMLQRVMIAAALAGEPRLLLADEPTTALDMSIQAEVIALLARLRAERDLGLLFVTHDLDLAGAICDRIYVMYAGRIVEHRPAADLFRSPRHPYTAALLASRPRLDRAADRLDAVRGRPLGLDESVPGCGFAPRCDGATDACLRGSVPLTAIGDEPSAPGQVACLHPAEVAAR
ncbi:ABC transporter ATP-binding protein [Streptomyces sp. NPDC056296]|uniref:ABC transporter ATP-binding protein n=1 Tax=Streptomyces sp. NPDC056296 TaxID=3345775 RepID=UPI0035D57CC7